jgi:hypothetical protein
MTKLIFVKDDGGRADAGFSGRAGDCVTRAIAIAAARPYMEVYQAMARGQGSQRLTASDRRRGRSRHAASARDGVNVRRKWFKDYMASIGFVWVPTMKIGSGCQVHLHDDELPMGRLIVSVSGHYTAVVDGAIRDTFDPRRETHYVRSGGGGAGDPAELRPGEWRNANGICGISRRCVYGYWIAAEVGR